MSHMLNASVPIVPCLGRVLGRLAKSVHLMFLTSKIFALGAIGHNDPLVLLSRWSDVCSHGRDVSHYTPRGAWRTLSEGRKVPYRISSPPTLDILPPPNTQVVLTPN
ncbi:hypothetical protein LSAT2_006204 [Lamellibrachia satsuma]|nr:hypothetical protein LSAT2_006204 [Lamellibrachia satsuma]